MRKVTNVLTSVTFSSLLALTRSRVHPHSENPGYAYDSLVGRDFISKREAKILEST